MFVVFVDVSSYHICHKINLSRSVAHQSRLCKIVELVSQGELDPNKPLLEQPGGQPQKTIGELIPQGLEQV